MALPLVLIVTLLVSDLFFSLVVALVSAVALWEFYSMVMDEHRAGEKYAAIAVGVLVVFAASCDQLLLVEVLPLCFIAVAVAFLARFRDINVVVSELGLIALGWLYIPVLLSHMIMLHSFAAGRGWVVLVLAMTMLCDSCAYFAGSKWGRHSLYPAISPNKTVEGAVGGLLGALIAAAVGSLWLPEAVAWHDLLAVGVLVGIFGQLGDLFESMVKRYAGSKDSGTIFPGHGGMLDRVDSLLFAFPCVYAYLVFSAGTM